MVSEDRITEAWAVFEERMLDLITRPDVSYCYTGVLQAYEGLLRDRQPIPSDTLAGPLYHGLCDDLGIDRDERREVAPRFFSDVRHVFREHP